MNRPQTRAQWLGVQPGRLAARTKRRVAKIRAVLIDIAADWNEAHPAIGDECDAMIDQFEALVAEGIERLREPLDQ
jgi:hypothetical protein